MDEQLRWCRQPQTFFPLSDLYLVMLRICSSFDGMQLLFLLVGRLRV